jgi:hypothetical protein
VLVVLRVAQGQPLEATPFSTRLLQLAAVAVLDFLPEQAQHPTPHKQEVLVAAVSLEGQFLRVRLETHRQPTHLKAITVEMERVLETSTLVVEAVLVALV